MPYAPIILFVYNRPNHLEKTLAELAKNKLIGESELYIYLDGPKSIADKEKVERVKRVINDFSSAKKINKIYREENQGLAKSIIAGVSEVLEKHDSAIILEDDLVTSANFLEYMNDALKYYRDNTRIYSITGYSLPLKSKQSIEEDVFFSPRAGSWGWATWKDRWPQADWDVADYQEFKSNPKIQKEFNLGGEDLTPMLKAQMSGNINSWAIRWCYSLYKKGGLCVYPKVSKVNHIGNDPDGTHVPSTNKYDVEIDKTERRTRFTKDIGLNKNILEEINDIIKPSLQRKIINYFKYDFLK